MTSRVKIFQPKKLHIMVKEVLKDAGCSTIEQYADEHGIESAARLAAFSKTLSEPALKPALEDDIALDNAQPAYSTPGHKHFHWWIDCIAFFEEVTDVDYKLIEHRWQEIVSFVEKLQKDS